jgi:hypothetical protein
MEPVKEPGAGRDGTARVKPEEGRERGAQVAAAKICEKNGEGVEGSGRGAGDKDDITLEKAVGARPESGVLMIN